MHHRRLVRKHCFRVGLYWQGLTHDMSKFSPAEFFPGVKYYQGTRSPQARERELFGYSAAWLHHKGRNKHHFEYWSDSDAKGGFITVKMPPKYFAEMICDRIAASKTYKGKDYTDYSPLEYYQGRKDNARMHPETAKLLEDYLTMLGEQGEDAMFARLKQYVKDSKKRAKAEKRVQPSDNKC